jgi:hypothetical protein
MTAFLGEIGGRLADRWAALLAIPGLLYVAAITAAAVLGQRDALSYSLLSQKVTAWADSPVLRSPGGAVLIVAAILAGSMIAGMTVTTAGSFTEILWTLPGRHLPARWLVDWRKARASALKAIADNPGSTPSQVATAIHRADRICLIEPDRPTWIGDRLRVCHVRIARAYGLDLTTSWPRLWLVIPDTARAELGLARDAFRGAAQLTAWGIFYLILGGWWWPALPVALVIAVTGVIKGRIAADNLADLIESAVDLYGAELGTQLGVPGPLTLDIGKQLTSQMLKSRWDPASPVAD